MIGPCVRLRSVRQSVSPFASFLLKVEFFEDVILVSEFAVWFSLLFMPLEERRLRVREILVKLKGDEVFRHWKLDREIELFICLV